MDPVSDVDTLEKASNVDNLDKASEVHDPITNTLALSLSGDMHSGDMHDEESLRKLDFAERRNEPMASAATATPPPTSLEERMPKGKLYFLFMLKDTLPHVDVWKAFFSGAPAGSYRIFAHCSKPDLCRNAKAFSEMQIQMVATVPSKWCVDLVSPMFQLVRAALSMQGGSASAGDGVLVPAKFVLVSDSTVPVQTISRMRQILLKTDHSDICMTKEDEWASANISGVTYSVVKHSQWAVLSREDAERFVKGWEQLSAYGAYERNGVVELGISEYRWNVPRMGSDGHANLSASIPRLAVPDSGRCPDEEVFASMAFGLHEPGRDALWNEIRARSVCRTWVNWGCKGCKMGEPEVFSKVPPWLEDLTRDSSETAYLFARKFESNASLEFFRSYFANASTLSG